MKVSNNFGLVIINKITEKNVKPGFKIRNDKPTRGTDDSNLYSCDEGLTLTLKRKDFLHLRVGIDFSFSNVGTKCKNF